MHYFHKCANSCTALTANSMQGLSLFPHEDFVNNVRRRLESCVAEGDAFPDTLLQELSALEQLFDNYQARVTELKEIVNNYQNLHRRIRLATRKQRLSAVARN